MRVQQVANNGRLADLCHTTGLADCINPSPSQIGPIQARTASATVEAAVGAAYKTGGMRAAETVMHSLGII